MVDLLERLTPTYNHQRTHHGLDGLLVPADRFYGLAERTLKMIEEGQGGHALDIGLSNGTNGGVEYRSRDWAVKGSCPVAAAVAVVEKLLQIRWQ